MICGLRTFSTRSVSKNWPRNGLNDTIYRSKFCKQTGTGQVRFHGSMMTPHINITPTKLLVDDVMTVKVSRLPPSRMVTLACRIAVDGNRFWSHAVYEADVAGNVDLGSHPALDGSSYTGVDPMGLIWSQEPEPAQRTGIRLMKNDVTTPIDTHIYVLDGVVPPGQCLESIEAGRWVARGSCERRYLASDVRRVEVRHGRLQGTLFLPPGDGPHPGVIDLFGTIGGTVEHRSALLASRGIASLALAYYFPKEDVICSDMEYFELAVDYLLALPQVCKPQVGIIGVSLGGMLALAAASFIPKIGACVEIAGTLHVFFIDVTYKGQTIKGNDSSFDLGAVVTTDEGFQVEAACTALLRDSNKDAILPVENGRCEYLLIHGEDDTNIGLPTPAFITKHMADRNINHRLLLYPGAGHLIEPPFSPHFRSSYNPLFNGLCVWGGRPKTHNQAQVDAWTHVIRLFKSKLANQSQL